jgi:single-strand DNA-binding protein
MAVGRPPAPYPQLSRPSRASLHWDAGRGTRRLETSICLSLFQDSEKDEDEEEELSDEELLATAGKFDEKIPRLNTIHLTGRVGNDPEPRYLDDGKVVLNLSLACRRKLHWEERQALDVQWGEEETDWYRLEIWSGLAEFVAKYVDKGARIGVIGSILEDEFTDRETGELVSTVKVVVRELDLLETKAEGDLRRSNKGRTQGSSSSGARQQQADWPSSAGSGDFF